MDKTLAEENEQLTAALEYASHWEWLVVPLHSKDKRPRPNGWQKAATNDVEVIAEWWKRWPDSNVGVKLGRDSNIIDIECDSDEAEASLAALFGGEFPETATYQATRGKHRLFQWRGDLPYPEKAAWKIGQIEFRTGGGDKGAQSVFPPSIHPTGAVYEWVLHPSKVGVAKIPDEVVANIINACAEGLQTFEQTTGSNPNSPRHRLYKEEMVVEGGRNNALYTEACAQWNEKFRVYGPSVFADQQMQGRIFTTIWSFNRAKCNPPLDDNDVHTLCESARQFVSANADDSKKRAGLSLTEHGLEFDAGEWWPGNWELVVVRSDPVRYKIIVPKWRDLIQSRDDGAIVVIGEHYSDPAKIAQAVLAATGTVILNDVPGKWQSIWCGSKGKGRGKDQVPGKRGLMAKLMDRCKYEEPLPEEQRYRVVAELLAEKLSKAKKMDTPDERGITLLVNKDGNETGEIWLRWTKVWQQEVQFGDVKPDEISKLRQILGIQKSDSRQFPTNGARKLRYIVLTRKHLTKLDDLCQ